MVENSFEGYIGLFIFYILPINYATFISQILIFGFNWVQKTIVPTLNTIRIIYHI